MNTSQSKLTRQGVRDLNPPRVNGKRPSCPCRRDPSTATRVDKQLRTVTVQTAMGPIPQERWVGVHFCLYCGVERFSEHDED